MREQDFFGICPYYTVQHLLRGKWTIRILSHLEEGPIRFRELMRCIPDLTGASLLHHLKRLEQSGLVQRMDYGEKPSRVEYSLTETGRSLIPILDGMCEWGDLHRPPA